MFSSTWTKQVRSCYLLLDPRRQHNEDKMSMLSAESLHVLKSCTHQEENVHPETVRLHPGAGGNIRPREV